MTIAFLDKLLTLKKSSIIFGYSLFLDYGPMPLFKQLPNLYYVPHPVCGTFLVEVKMDIIDPFLDLSIEFLDTILVLLLLELFF
jgi:hypothetical protein